VRLAIYDVQGRLVSVLREGYHGGGEYGVSWDGRGRDGASAAGGVYFVRLEADGETQSRKILLLK
jgi:flagellar hook assembly protein FlgD